MLSPIRLEIDPIATSPFPLDLELIKQHCAIDFDDQDTLLETYALAAIEAFENTTHRTLIKRSHVWVLKHFPYAPYQEIRLPRGRTVSVEQIEYVSGNQTFTLTGPSSDPVGTGYQEDLRGDEGGILMPPRGQSWPSTDIDVPAPVSITFTAGWEIGELPQQVLNALLFHIRSSLDDNRTDPAKAEANMRTFEAMVSGYRLTRFY